MKKYIKLLLLVSLFFSITGCFKRDEYEDITIYTTVYPIEFITQKLYGNHATISSIYPNEVDISNYVLTTKKLTDYSKGNIFIYNGLSNEKDIAATLLNKNKKMDIIDVSQGLEIKNDLTELWLSPSNFLMMTSNIKNGLETYITYKGILDEIDKNYDDLKLTISEFDAELKLIAENGKKKKIFVANNTFKFLEKYGYEVICIASDDENSNTNISQAEKAFSSKESSYLFELAGTEENDTIKNLVSKGAKKVDVPTMITLTEEQRKNNNDYIILMQDFIEKIKAEVY